MGKTPTLVIVSHVEGDGYTQRTKWKQRGTTYPNKDGTGHPHTKHTKLTNSHIKYIWYLQCARHILTL